MVFINLETLEMRGRCKEKIQVISTHVLRRGDGVRGY
jgi:hypothetical protein